MCRLLTDRQIKSKNYETEGYFFPGLLGRDEAVGMASFAQDTQSVDKTARSSFD